jgi:L-alanine-DL-glutamate epimerase-like enolase superfamily enzyme
MTLSIDIQERAWPLHEPLAIARGVQDTVPTIQVTIVDEHGHRGRGEACGVDYAGETIASMTAQIEAVLPSITPDITRDALLSLLPAGGARYAVDSALWDLEAKQSGESAFVRAGVKEPKAVQTARTIGIRSTAEYFSAARAHAEHALLKIKVDASDPLGALAAVRRGAPDSSLIVDPNQSWSVEQLKALAPHLSALGVVLLEQPIPVGDEGGLEGYRCPIPICADELINDERDLSRAKGRFDFVNIKLDKAGGLTSALRLADAATAAGFKLMVGCMVGSSLSMAPAMILAQRCAFVDLDGPLLQSEDWPDGLRYESGWVSPPAQHFWG